MLHKLIVKVIVLILVCMISYIFLFLSFLPLLSEWQDNRKWQLVDSEYYSVEVPPGWKFYFGDKKTQSLHKRNISVPNEEGRLVKYELGTLTWCSDDDFEIRMTMDIRSFRDTSGEAAPLEQVFGKIAEASWPEGLGVVEKEEGGVKGAQWKQFLLKGEDRGFSVTTGAYKYIAWKYMYFVEKDGNVYVVSVYISDEVRSSSTEYYDGMARRIIKSFKVK